MQWFVDVVEHYLLSFVVVLVSFVVDWLIDVCVRVSLLFPVCLRVF